MKKTFILLLFILLSTSCAIIPATGQKKFILVSFSQEQQLGEQAYKEFLQKESGNISKDLKINALVKRVALRITSNSDLPNIDWQVTVINSSEVNAFALPGGKIVIYTGILPQCKTEAGLATVIGHEVAHVTARHGAQRITKGLGVSAGLAIADLSLNNTKYRDLILGSLALGGTGLTLKYSRDDEYEADYIGLKYMAKAGYSPTASISFWDRFSKVSKNSGFEFLSTHPYSEHRALKLKENLPKMEALYNQSPKYGEGDTL